MTRPWFEASPELLQEVRSTIASEQPDLRIEIANDLLAAHGSFVVRDDSGVLDRYQIEIRFPRDYPKSIPLVEEVGGRIPRILDRHISLDGTACLLVPEEWLLSEDQSFIAFLTGPIKNFFLGQILAEAGKPWPFGERSHGRDGLVESYSELLGLDDPGKVVAYLDCLRKKELKGHLDCPCGSKKRLRNCHRSQLKGLRKRVPTHIAQRAYDRLRDPLAASRKENEAAGNR
jgi:hypothetical protein